MTSQERLLKSLAHQEPDRLSLDLGGFTTTMEQEVIRQPEEAPVNIHLYRAVSALHADI